MVKGLLFHHEMAKLKVTVNCPIGDPQILPCFNVVVEKSRPHNIKNKTIILLNSF